MLEKLEQASGWPCPDPAEQGGKLALSSLLEAGLSCQKREKMWTRVWLLPWQPLEGPKGKIMRPDLSGAAED